MEAQHVPTFTLAPAAVEAAGAINSLLRPTGERYGDMGYMRIAGGTAEGRDLLASALMEIGMPHRAYAGADAVEVIFGPGAHEALQVLDLAAGDLSLHGAAMVGSEPDPHLGGGIGLAALRDAYQASRVLCTRVAEHLLRSARAAVHAPWSGTAETTPAGVVLRTSEGRTVAVRRLPSDENQGELERLIASGRYEVCRADGIIAATLTHCEKISIAGMPVATERRLPAVEESPRLNAVAKAVQIVRKYPAWFSEAVRWWNLQRDEAALRERYESPTEICELSDAIARTCEGVVARRQDLADWVSRAVFLAACTCPNFNPADVGAEGLSCPVPEPHFLQRPGAIADAPDGTEWTTVLDDSLKYLRDHPPAVPAASPIAHAPPAEPTPETAKEKAAPGGIIDNARWDEPGAVANSTRRGTKQDGITAALEAMVRKNGYTGQKNMLRCLSETQIKANAEQFRRAINASQTLRHAKQEYDGRAAGSRIETTGGIDADREAAETLTPDELLARAELSGKIRKLLGEDEWPDFAVAIAKMNAEVLQEFYDSKREEHREFTQAERRKSRPLGSHITSHM